MDLKSEEKNNYKHILKVTSLFGGVQVYTILISILRSKVIAVLLGPSGMGIAGLLTSTTSLIASFTNLGLSTSAVKDIAQANSSNDFNRVSRITLVFKKLIKVTGGIGFLICVALAPYWSKLTFGNLDYTVSFCLLSITLLLNQLLSGKTTILQGLGRYSQMAKATLLGNTLGLFFTVPIYFIFKIDAIVPALIITSIITLLTFSYYSRKLRLEEQAVSIKSAFIEGKDMVKMGFFLGLQNILSVLSAYLIRIFIGYQGGVADVGLYAAGFSIINTYVGLVLTSMSTEYYPRLSTCVSDNTKFISSINQQIEIGILLISPIAIIFIVFLNTTILALYSNQFLAVKGMLYWGILGMYFRVLGWSIAYAYLAKGNTKAFFYNELIAIAYTTALTVLFYHFAGLTGIGLSIFLTYIIYFIQVWLVTQKIYAFKISKKVFKLFAIQFTLGSLCLFFVLTDLEFKYLFELIIIVITFSHVYKELNKRIDIKKYIHKYIK